MERHSGVRVLISAGYLHLGKGKQSLKFISNHGGVTMVHGCMGGHLTDIKLWLFARSEGGKIFKTM
jgi:hypothetical protein